MNAGLTQLVDDHVDIARRCVTDTRTGQQLTLAEALDKGIINPARGTVKDARSGRTMTLEDAVKRRIVDADLVDELRAHSGLTDATGSDLSVLEALKRGLIDSASGQVHGLYQKYTTTCF